MNIQSFSHLPPLLRYTLLTLIALSAVMLVKFVVFNYTEITGKEAPAHALGRDFHIFYTATQLASAQNAAQVYNEEAFYKAQSDFTGTTFASEYGYPPTYTALIEWFSALDYKTAFVCWLILQLGLFMAALRLFGTSPWVIVICSFMPIMTLSLNWGQNGALYAAIYLLMFHYLHKRPWVSGLLLALAATKPHLGLLVFIYLIGAKHYKVLAAGLVWGLLSIAYTAIRYGSEVWFSYIQYMLARGENYIDKHQTTTIGGLLEATGAGPMTIQVISLIWLLLFALFCFRLGKQEPSGNLYTMLLLFTASAIALPYIHSYDYVLLSTLAIIALWRAAHQHAQRPALIALGLLASYYYAQSMHELALYGLYLYVPIGLAVFTALYATGHKGRT